MFNKRRTKQFWLRLGNLSAIGAVIMLTMAAVSAQDNINLMMLPVGDGQLSTTTPAVGSVFSCTVPRGGGGASAAGPWFSADMTTFDLTAKALVDGAVAWNGTCDITLTGDTRILSGNGLPIDDTTGTYPIAQNDDAYPYDRNPNSIAAQVISVEVPTNPTVAAQASCLQLGGIGVLLSGVQLFNALDGEGRDAVAWETQDGCQGHPERNGAYHYHNLSTCVTENEDGVGHSELVGYIYDGFGLYGHYGENGEVVTNADLDTCHGHTHIIEWDGQTVEMYHYHATFEYPYTVGCYRGTPAEGIGQMMGSPGGNQQGPPNGQPPQGGGNSGPPRGGGNGSPPPQGGSNGGPPPRQG